MGVATSIAIGMALASAGASAAQAAKQSRMQKQAEAEAQRAMEEARKRLDVNFYDKLSVKKEPYELAIEAANVAAAGAIEAARESERGVAGAAGRIAMADNEQQRKIATAYGQDLMRLEELSATEDSRLRDVNTQLDIAQVEGAQKAARDAQEAKTAATTSAIQSGISAVGQGIGAAALYGQNAKQQKIANKGFTEGWSQEDFSKLGNMDSRFGFGSAVTGGSNIDADVIRSMDRNTFNNWWETLDKEKRNILLGGSTGINPFDFSRK